MAANAKLRGFKAVLGYDAAGTTTFVDLGTIVDAIEGTSSMEVVDTSLLADDFKTYVKAQGDGGQITFVVSYDPAGDESKAIADMFYNLDSLPNWQIEVYVDVSTVRTETFKALLVGIGRSISKGAMATSAITLQISGNPNYTKSA